MLPILQMVFGFYYLIFTRGELNRFIVFIGRRFAPFADIFIDGGEGAFAFFF